jgi:hypothetical protein
VEIAKTKEESKPMTWLCQLDKLYHLPNGNRKENYPTYLPKPTQNTLALLKPPDMQKYMNSASIFQHHKLLAITYDQPTSMYPFTTSQQRWELPKQQFITAKVTSTTQSSKPPSHTHLSSPKWVQNGARVPNSSWHPSSSSSCSKRIITA